VTEAETTAPAETATDAGRIAAAAARLMGEPTEAAEPAPTDAAPEAESAPSEQAEAPEAKPEPDAPISPQLAAVARAKRKADAEIATARAELEKQRAEIEERAKGLGQAEELTKLALTDPAKFFEQIGAKDRKEIARLLWFAELGDQAPAEYRERIRARSMEQQIEELRQEREKERQEAEQRAQVDQGRQMITAYRGAIESHLAEVPETMPLVRAAAGHDSQGTADALMQLAIRHAEANPSGQPLTPPQLAQMLEGALEKELAPFRGVFAPIEQPKQGIAVGGESRPGTKTLSNSKTATPTAQRPAALTEDERIARAAQALTGAWS
jgi:hypothetical protein